MNDLIKDFEIVKDFLTETHEGLAQVDLDLVALENDPANAGTLARVFRTIHSIKGTAGFLGLAQLEAVAHAGEGLLSQLRDGQRALSSEMISVLLRLVDTVRQILTDIEANQSEGASDHADLIETLERLQRGPSRAAQFADMTAPAAPGALASTQAFEPSIRSGPDGTIRVDVALLDELMNLVGELVLARNQIVQATSQQDSRSLSSTQHLNRITSELQEGVMRTRLQRIGTLWRKLPRFVRDLALACGKEVKLEVRGAATELDKSIIEAIADPLLHLVRNAIDHGIESPARRRACGKPAAGRLFLSAFHEGGRVNIEITDDGAGMDLERIKARAIETKLITAEQAAHLSEREAVELVFRPGFSTAEQLTAVSGRGVGMDVVRANLDKIGGTVDIFTRSGRGTTVQLKIPLTLAIISALVVASRGERFAIPQSSLLELVHLAGDQSAIEEVHGVPVYRLRGNLLPLVFLDRVLGLDGDPSGAMPISPRPEGVNPEGVNIVVLQADDRQFGLAVDVVFDTEEIVVKPLQKPLKGLSVFAGATIMGDGKVVLILDVVGMAQHVGVTAGVGARETIQRPETAATSAGGGQSLLLMATPEGGRLAVAISQVTRLEEIPCSTVEWTGGQAVVQYRGGILPLLDVSQALADLEAPSQDGRAARRRRAAEPQTADPNDRLQVVVHTAGDQRVGLMVGRILDIIADDLEVRSRAARRGILFSTVIQDHVTEVLDVEAILQAAELLPPERPATQPATL